MGVEWGERDRDRDRDRERFRRPSFLHFLFLHILVRLSVSCNNLSQSLSFFLLFFVLSCCVSQSLVSLTTFSNSPFITISCPLSVSFSLSYSFSCFCCSASLTFISVSFCCPFSCLCHPFYLCLSLFLSFSVTFGASACLSLPLPLFLVPCLTLFCSPGASVSVCLFSWCLKLPLLQSGCWDCGPKLPALGPRPLHFLNPLQLVSQRRAGCRENRKEVDPRGLSLRPLCPSCSWAARDRSAENILGEMPAWHPAHLGGRGGESWGASR